MTFAAWLIAAAVALLIAGVAGCAARSLHDFSRHEFEELAARRGVPAMLGDVLRWHDRVLLVAESVQLLAAAGAVASVVMALTHRAAVGPPWWEWVAVFAVGSLLLLIGNIWLPWAVARFWGARIVFSTWPTVKLLAQLLAPLTAGALLFGAVGRRLAGQQGETSHEETLEDEIRTIVTEGHREGLLEEEAREMIEGVIELRDISVSEVMTPRTDMISMPKSLGMREAAEFVVKAGHSRIPIVDKHRDDIVGILFSKDLLAELAKDPDDRKAAAGDIARPPTFVPETKSVAELLEEFQLSRNHMAIVLDEFGGVAGLITIEDILEEIVGEIIDEYDEDVVEGIRRIDERTAEALARVHVDEINERLGLDLPEHGEFDTIGGFVFSELGHLPAPGDQVVHKNVRITVLDIHRRRIERVRIEILDDQPQPAREPSNSST